MINKHPIYEYNINICIFCSQSILYNQLYNLTRQTTSVHQFMGSWTPNRSRQTFSTKFTTPHLDPSPSSYFTCSCRWQL